VNRTYQTRTAEETEAVGRGLAERLLSAGVRRAFIAMRGEMGVGKTAFARGFASALGITGVKSPTYTVVNEHKGNPVPFFHLDLYRLGGEEDLESIGYDDYLARDGYLLCEWSESLPDAIPPDAITVTIRRGAGEGERMIEIEEDA